MRFIRNGVGLLLGIAVVTGARAADTYKIDPAHTGVGFSISHLVISEVNGRFDDVAGTVTVDNDALAGASATIQVKSIDTAIKKRDDHLRSPDFFDAEKYPTITFESTKVTKDGDKTVIAGKFTMHGVTKEIQFPVVLKGPVKGPRGNPLIAVTAETTINRTDYGMKTFMGVGDDVKIRINVEATKAEEKK